MAKLDDILNSFNLEEKIDTIDFLKKILFSEEFFPDIEKAVGRELLPQVEKTSRVILNYLKKTQDFFLDSKNNPQNPFFDPSKTNVTKEAEKASKTIKKYFSVIESKFEKTLETPDIFKSLFGKSTPTPVPKNDEATSKTSPTLTITETLLGKIYIVMGTMNKGIDALKSNISKNVELLEAIRVTNIASHEILLKILEKTQFSSKDKKEVSDKTETEKMEEMFSRLFGKFSPPRQTKEKEKDVKYSTAPNEQENPITSNGGWDITGVLMSLIGGGVFVAAVYQILTDAWDKQLKPWFEQKFQKPLEIFDTLKNTVNNISKFFTLQGLTNVFKTGLNISKSIVTLSDVLVDFFKNTLDDIIKVFLPTIAPTLTKTIGGATSFLSKILGAVGKIGAKLSLAGLKAIPLIGAAISFGFAYKSFERGDWANGILDIINGLVGLTPGVGIFLSLGVSALQTFLDFKSGEGTQAEKNQKKMDLLASGLSKIWNFLKELPIIRSFMAFGESISLMADGQWKKGLETLSTVPVIGMIAGTILGIMDEKESAAKENRPFSFISVVKKIRDKVIKSLIDSFPEEFGIRQTVADILGVKLEEKDFSTLEQKRSGATKAAIEKFQKITDSSEIGETLERYEKRMEDLRKQLIQERALVSEYQRGNRNIDIKDKEKNIELLQSNLLQTKELIDALKAQQTKVQEESAEDLFIPSGSSRYVFDRSSQTKYNLSDHDEVLAMKPGGAFDKGIQKIADSVKSMNNIIEKMSERITQNISEIGSRQAVAPQIIPNTQNITGKRDEIYNTRMDWWRISGSVRLSV